MAGSEKPGCLGLILRALGIDITPRKPSYRLRDDFLSRAEASFFKVLQTAVGDSAVVWVKVRLGDLFFVSDRKNNLSDFNKISAKHVDFLLGDPETLNPLLGIELDDSSHQRPGRQGRDAFVDEVFEVAGLPLLHLPARKTYSVQEVRDLVRKVMVRGADVSSEAPSSRSAAVEAAVAAEKSNPPLCPKCGAPMELRSARRGPNRGEGFWGCRNYPRCRGIVEKS